MRLAAAAAVANNTLSSKTILITGGTSRLGRTIIQKSLSEGARVFFTYYQNQAEANSLIKLGAEGFPLELTDSKAIEELAVIIKEKTDHLDVLIHNAAAVRDHTIQNLTEKDWDYVINADLKAPYYLTKKLLPLLFRKKSVKVENEKLAASKIFFITSRAAVSGGYGISNYAAAKAGLIGLTKSLAQELGKKKILVNAVNPGFMISGMTENLPQNVLDYHSQLSPIGRYSETGEVADFIVYLSSDQMTQVTGQVFHFESRKIS